MNTTPILITVLYAPYGDYKASLRIRSNNDADLAITVIHHGLDGLAQYDIEGNAETDSLIVQDNENIVILARRDSIVLGSGVFQVDTELPETTPLLLRPCSVTNMDIDQCDFGVMTRAMSYALDKTFNMAPVLVEEGAQVL